MLVIVWRVTEKCNLHCPFCAYGNAEWTARRDADPASIRQLGRVFAEYQQTMNQPILVSWLGGEPLLWKPLQSLSEHFVRDLHLQVSTTTNGTPLSSNSVRDHITSCYRELTVSIDGFSAFHDAIRQFPGGFDSLRKQVQSLAAYPQRPLLRANTVLMSDNVRNYPDLCRELTTWGFDELTFNQLGGNDRPEFHAQHRLTPEDLNWLQMEMPRLQSQLRDAGVALRCNATYWQRLVATSRGQQIPIENCHPGVQFLFISERGLVSPCSFTDDAYGVPIDEIRSMDDLLQLPQRFAELRRSRLHPACLDCHSTHVFAKFRN